MDCLPVLEQVMLVLVRSAKLFGRLFPSYKAPTLCFATGPCSIVTEIPVSCSPPHLLQATTMLYCAVELCGLEGGASSIGTFAFIVGLLC